MKIRLSNFCINKIFVSSFRQEYFWQLLLYLKKLKHFMNFMNITHLICLNQKTVFVFFIFLQPCISFSQSNQINYQAHQIKSHKKAELEVINQKNLMNEIFDYLPINIFTKDKEELSESVQNKKELLELLFKEGKKGINVQRYKGLGEMNPEQLWESTMNPDTRILYKVKIEDAVEADEIFSLLMGEEVEPRRDFIQTNALEVSSLDI